MKIKSFSTLVAASAMVLTSLTAVAPVWADAPSHANAAVYTLASNDGSNAPDVEGEAPADPGESPRTVADNGEGLNAVIPTPQKVHFDKSGAPLVPASGSKVIAPASEPQILADAQLFAKELQKITGIEYPVVTGQEVAAGDIEFVKDDIDGLPEGKSDEGYRLDVAGHAIVTAPTVTGLFWGGQTILQSLRSAGLVQSAHVVDWSAYPVRSLHVDAARKYFPPEWFKKEIDRMASLKINQLQWHFSENEGFRLESKTHPDVMSDQYITQEQAKDIVAYAKARHVKVVPAYDMPGHLKFALRNHPELRAGSDQFLSKMLDYSKPEARKFLTDMIDEFAPIFAPNSDTWMIGGDEVFPMDWISWRLNREVPQLLQYARDEIGPQASVMDGYMKFLSDMNTYVRGKGFTETRVWSDLLYTSDHFNIPSNMQVAYWTQWSALMPSTQKLIDKGHKLLNVSDAYFYYVLPACPTCAYHTHADAAKILAEYQPRNFPEKAHALVPEDSVLGSSYAIWADNPNLKTPEFVGEDSLPMLAAMSQTTWKPLQQLDAKQFVRRVRVNDGTEKPIEAPRVSTKTVVATDPQPGQLTDGQQVAYTATITNTGNQLADVIFNAIAEGATWSGTKLALTPEPSSDSPNMAQGQPVTASGTELPDRFSAKWATDGVTEPAASQDRKEQRWSSNTADDAWIYVNLGQPQALDHVTLQWELCAAKYRIQVSNDARTWTDATDLVTHETCPEGADTQTLSAPGKWQYVKMQGVKRTPAANGNYYGMSLFEFQVFGPATPVDASLSAEGGQLTWHGQLPVGGSATITAKLVPAEGAQQVSITSRTLAPTKVSDEHTFTLPQIELTPEIIPVVTPEATPLPTPVMTPELPSRPEPTVHEVVLERATQPVSFWSRDVDATNLFGGEIQWMITRGLSTGWPDGMFRPFAPITRAAFAAFLFRLDAPVAWSVPTAASFKDVPTGHQFARQIAWAANVGITNGWSDGTFRPEQPISREAIAAFLYRFCQQSSQCRPDLRPGAMMAVPQLTFTDTAGSQFQNEINWLARTRVTTGWPDGTFRPTLPAQRQAVAAMLYRITHNYVK